MTNYYVANNDCIVLVDTNKQKLKDTLLFMPQLQNCEIKETEKEIVNINGEYHFFDEKIVETYQKQERKQEIIEELDKLDLQSIRAIRTNDLMRMAEYEASAEKLRKELQELGV